ncbi:hypothetical protein BCR39DRAFT_552974 [Naematelia encephala]|uniref:BHLH domain-containing protein n=1 Tax=Naematelia encephala TaxID=71784 RepID=A0A1Y2AGW5_9TREE|nr:hypothetical protein BCR39DRAFT_552974 [Naematelia encephala]
MATIRTEGFQVPGQLGGSQPTNHRPSFARPISDGSLAVGTDMLLSIHQPFGYMQTMYEGFQYNEHPEPPIDETHFGRSFKPEESNIGKAPKAKFRKGSMTNEIRPTERQPPRSQSMHAPHPRYSMGNSPTSWGTPSLVSGSFGSYAEDALMESPMTPVLPLVDDTAKKQRRRECHNQVEKRRREHINAKIDELSHLLPPKYLLLDEAVEDEEEEDADSPKKKSKRSGSTNKQKDAGQCKGRILQQSVHYIHDLVQLNAMQSARIRELEGTSGNQAPLWSYGYGHPLEAMRPSPEPEWPQQAPQQLRRSPSTAESQQSSLGEQQRGRQRDRRVGSDAEIQASMSGMDLDAMFAGRREEELGAMRW